MDGTSEIIWSNLFIFQKPINLGILPNETENNIPGNIKECGEKANILLIKGRYQTTKSAIELNNCFHSSNFIQTLSVSLNVYTYSLPSIVKSTHPASITWYGQQAGFSLHLSPVFLQPFNAHQHLQQKAEKMKLQFINVNC